MRSIFKYIFVFLLAFVFSTSLYAQCMMESLSLDQIIDGSEQIYEGEITERNSYRDATSGAIYTRYTVDLTQTLGRNGQTRAYITTQGGVVDGYAQMVYPSLQLAIGDRGVFMCKSSGQGMQVYGLSHGFFKYEEGEHKAINVFGEKIDMDKLKQDISTRKGKQFYKVEGYQRYEIEAIKSEQAVVINSVTPTVITAGTRDVLTIRGAGFGSNQLDGKVSFKNANNGGSSYIDVPNGPHILLWSDTLIEVTVPSATVYGQYVAGTGPIRVYTANGGTAVSLQQVNVKYAKSEIYYTGSIQHTDVADVNGNGGYTFFFGPGIFNNQEVKTSFTRALHNWKCSTHINISPNTEAPSNVGINFNDNISLVEFDTDGSLPAGILGSTVISYSSCTFDGETHWVMTEMDMVLNPDFVWHHGPEPVATGKFDFESAILHELGHAHLIQHNMNTESVMYYRLTTGQARRNLQLENDIGATNHVMTDSEHLQGCYTGMLPAEDDACNEIYTSVNEDASGNLNTYPNPNSGQFFIEGFELNDEVRVEIFNSMGAMILNEFPTSERLSIDLGSVASGIYCVKVFEGDKLSLTQKVMISGR